MEQDKKVIEETKVESTEVTEQPVDNENQVETKVEETKPLSKTELLREMSKEYGVNLFDAEGLAKFKEYQESLKTEQEKLQDKLNEYTEKENTYKKQLEEKEAQVAALRLGLPDENLNDALVLAKNYMQNGESISEGLAKVKEKYAGLFNAKKGSDTRIVVGTQYEDDSTQQENLDPALARYLAKNKNKKF
jgi:hypothetical protein